MGGCRVIWFSMGSGMRCTMGSVGAGGWLPSSLLVVFTCSILLDKFLTRHRLKTSVSEDLFLKEDNISGNIAGI
jgi:hypothetical protein